VKVRHAWWVTPLIWILDTLPVPDRIEDRALKLISSRGSRLEAE
jgi:hypothetical protein